MRRRLGTAARIADVSPVNARSGTVHRISVIDAAGVRRRYYLKQYAAANDALQRALALDLSPEFADEAQRVLNAPDFQKALAIEDYGRGAYAKALERLTRVTAPQDGDPARNVCPV